MVSVSHSSICTTSSSGPVIVTNSGDTRNSSIISYCFRNWSRCSAFTGTLRSDCLEKSKYKVSGDTEITSLFAWNCRQINPSRLEKKPEERREGKEDVST